jgi:hypothetical protein
MNDQKNPKHNTDARMERDPAMQPSVSHSLGFELQSLFYG